MSTDLDDLFATLGRQADHLPIGTADQARARGRQRTRRHAVLAIAAAVLLTAVGVGAAAGPPAHRAVPPVTTPVDRHAIPRVGSPIPLGDVATAKLGTGGGRVFAAWVDRPGDSIRLTAADLRTGARSWVTEQIVDPHRTLDQLVVTAAAILVITRSRDEWTTEVGLFAFDPGTGAPLWQSTTGGADELIFTRSALVRMASTSGLVEARDWVTGAQRWAAEPAGDRPVKATGMATPADEARITGDDPPVVFGDDRVVLITNSGAIQVRDAGSGELRRALPRIPAADGNLVGYDGWLYTHDETEKASGPQNVRLTDLTGTAGSRAVPVPAGAFGTLGPCGTDRVCVITRPAVGMSQVTAVDVRAHRVAWTAPDQWGAERLASANGWTLVGPASLVLDPAGRIRYSSNLNASWLDARTLLVIAPDGTGRPAKLSTTDGKLTPIGASVAELAGNCTSTSDRLVCVDDHDLKVMRVG